MKTFPRRKSGRFAPSFAVAPKTSCDVPYSQRVNYDNSCPLDVCTTEEGCKRRGGCFERPPPPHDFDGTPWCYKEAGASECLIKREDRVNLAGCGNECGDKAVCESRGGCYEKPNDWWNSKTNMAVPWCYEGTILDSCDVPLLRRVSCTGDNCCVDKKGKKYKKREANEINNLKLCKTLPEPPDKYDKTINLGSVAYIMVGGGGKCSDLVPKSLNKLTPYKTFTEVKPGITKNGPGYTQQWAWINDGQQQRSIAVATPTTSKMPSDGWPVVFMFDFMGRDGMAEGWDQNEATNRLLVGGVAEQFLNQEFLDDDELTGLLTSMYYKRYLLSSGFAVVMLGEGMAYDTEDLFPCNLADSSGDQCWNEGNNPDANALRIVFEKIYSNTLVPSVSFNYDRVAISGYSVGANMCSRMMNEFPLMKTSSGNPMPKIRGAVLIGGGSYHCYQFMKDGNLTEEPANFKPCHDPANLGCCPTNLVEANYDDGVLNFSDHPPVCLIQAENDAYAPYEASEYYFNVLNSVGVPVYRVVAKGNRHGIMDSQIPAAIGFLQTYLQPKPVKPKPVPKPTPVKPKPVPKPTPVKPKPVPKPTPTPRPKPKSTLSIASVALITIFIFILIAVIFAAA